MYKTIFMVFEGDVMHDATVSPSRKHAHTILDVNSSIFGQQKRFTAVNFDFFDCIHTAITRRRARATKEPREIFNASRLFCLL